MNDWSISCLLKWAQGRLQGLREDLLHVTHIFLGRIQGHRIERPPLVLLTLPLLPKGLKTEKRPWNYKNQSQCHPPSNPCNCYPFLLQLMCYPWKWKLKIYLFAVLICITSLIMMEMYHLDRKDYIISIINIMNEVVLEMDLIGTWSGCSSVQLRLN